MVVNSAQEISAECCLMRAVKCQAWGGRLVRPPCNAPSVFHSTPPKISKSKIKWNLGQNWDIFCPKRPGVGDHLVSNGQGVPLQCTATGTVLPLLCCHCAATGRSATQFSPVFSQWAAVAFPTTQLVFSRYKASLHFSWALVEPLHSYDQGSSYPGKAQVWLLTSITYSKNSKKSVDTNLWWWSWIHIASGSLDHRPSWFSPDCTSFSFPAGRSLGGGHRGHGSSPIHRSPLCLASSLCRVSKWDEQFVAQFRQRNSDVWAKKLPPITRESDHLLQMAGRPCSLATALCWLARGSRLNSEHHLQANRPENLTFSSSRVLFYCSRGFDLLTWLTQKSHS